MHRVTAMHCVLVLVFASTASAAQDAGASTDSAAKAPARSSAASASGDTIAYITLGKKKRWGLDPVILQPGSHVFFTRGRQDPGEIAVFSDGKLSVDVQLFGGDLVYYRRDGRLRAGFNAGLGITQFNDANVLLTGASAFVQIGNYYRIDIGLMRARSGDNDLNASERDQSAWFTGIAFPTKLGEILKDLGK